MINIKENIKNVEEFNLLYDDVGWGVYDEKITQKALDNTFYSVSAYDDNKIVDIKKESIETKGGTVRCLKFLSNTSKTEQGMEINLKNVTYLMMNDSFLFTFAFMCPGKFIKGDNTNSFDILMSGLTFKN